MSATGFEHADAQHSAGVQHALMQNANLKINTALIEVREALQHEDTPERRKIEHELVVLADALEKEVK
jgi:hypothetical protein